MATMYKGDAAKAVASKFLKAVLALALVVVFTPVLLLGVQNAWADGAFSASIVSSVWVDENTVEIEFDQEVSIPAGGEANIAYTKTWSETALGASDTVSADAKTVTIRFSSINVSSPVGNGDISFNADALKDAAGNVNTAKISTSPKKEKLITKLSYSTSSLPSAGGSVVATLEGRILNYGGFPYANVYEGTTLIESIEPSYNETAHTFTFVLPANSGMEDKVYHLEFQNTKWTSTPITVQQGADDVVTVAAASVAADPKVNEVSYSATEFKSTGGAVAATLKGEALTQLKTEDLSLSLNGADAGISIAYTATEDTKATATFTLPQNTSTTDDAVYTFKIARGADSATGVPQDIRVKAVNTKALVESIDYIDRKLDPYHVADGVPDFTLFYHGGVVKANLAGENLDKLAASDFKLEVKDGSSYTAVDGKVEIVPVDAASAQVRFTVPKNEDFSYGKTYRFTVLCADAGLAGISQEFAIDHANESLEGKFRLEADKWDAASVGQGVVRVRVNAPKVILNPAFTDDKLDESERLDVKDYIFFANDNSSFNGTRNLVDGDKVEMRDGDIYIEFADKTAAIPSWVMFKGAALVADEDITVGGKDIHAGDTLAVRDENNHLHHSRYVQQTPHIESMSFNKITFTKEGGQVVVTMKGSRLNESDPALWGKVFIDSQKEPSSIVPAVEVNAAGDEATASFTVPANSTDKTISYRFIPVINGRNVISLYVKGYDVVSVLPEGGKAEDVTLSSVEIQGAYDMDDALDVFKTSTSSEQFTSKIDVIIRGTNLSSKKTLIKAVDENGIVWPTLPVFECGATIRWQNSANYLAEKSSKNEQHIELLLPRRLGTSHTFKLYFAPDGKNYNDDIYGTVIVENDGLFDLNDMANRGFTKDDLTKLTSIQVKYVDEAGKELAPADTYPGYGITELYHQGIAPKEIEGYKLKSYKPLNLDSMLKQPVPNSYGELVFEEGQYFFSDLKGQPIVYTYAKEEATPEPDPKDDPKDSPKDEPKTDPKDSPKDEPKTDPKTDPKKDDSKTDSKDDSKKEEPTSSIEPKPAAKQAWVRVAGNNQYDTSEQVSRTGWESADVVVLATGENYPDALSAAGVAGIEDAPVIITTTSNGQLSEQASRELARLKPGKILAIGGIYAMPESVVEAACAAAGGAAFERLAGNRASDTAAEMNSAYADKWAGDTAFLATSLNYPDALSAAPVAYQLGMPIYLVDHWDTVSDATYVSMKQAGISKLYILGGIYCVSDAAIADIEAHDIEVLGRLAGDSQYDTSLAIAQWGLAQGMSADHMGVACGLNYPDALTGAAFCGKSNAVMVLADSKNSETCLPVVADNRAEISFGYVFGGKFAVPYDIQNAYEKVSGCPATPAPAE